MPKPHLVLAVKSFNNSLSSKRLLERRELVQATTSQVSDIGVFKWKPQVSFTATGAYI